MDFPGLLDLSFQPLEYTCTISQLSCDTVSLALVTLVLLVALGQPFSLSSAFLFWSLTSPEHYSRLLLHSDSISKGILLPLVILLQEPLFPQHYNSQTCLQAACLVASGFLDTGPWLPGRPSGNAGKDDTIIYLLYMRKT